MKNVLFAALATASTLLLSVHAGGTARQVTVTSIEPAQSGSFILRITEREWGARTLHIRYNAARMRGVVSEQQHQAALAHLRADIAKNRTITLGIIGGDLARVAGSKSEYASDALELSEGVVYAWPTKR